VNPQAKLMGRTGSREIGMLIMADIVDFIELTFAMRGHNCNISDAGTQTCQFMPTRATQDAIIVSLWGCPSFRLRCPVCRWWVSNLAIDGDDRAILHSFVFFCDERLTVMRTSPA
jgi:hypothetical protein